MTNSRAINALIIDDNQEYIDSLITKCGKNRIILTGQTNLEDGITELRKKTDIEFVILDGKCFVDEENQEKNITKENIPFRAKYLIEEINRESTRFIQYCVNSAHSNLRENMEGIFDGIFEKQKGTDDMIEFIKNRVSRTEDYKIKNKFKRAFKAYDGYIDSNHEHLLLEAIKASKKEIKKKEFNTLRDIYESTLLALITFGVIPEEMKNTHGNPVMTICTEFIQGRTRGVTFNNETFFLKHNIPKNIQNVMTKIITATNDLSHLSDSENYKIRYMANLYCILELLEWIPEFYDENFK